MSKDINNCAPASLSTAMNTDKLYLIKKETNILCMMDICNVLDKKIGFFYTNTAGKLITNMTVDFYQRQKVASVPISTPSSITGSGN